MGVEIRAATPGEMEQFRHVTSSALFQSPDIYGNSADLARTAEWTVCAFEGGKLATGYRSWPWSMRFNGQAISVAAVNSVGTLPVYRRRGYLRKVTAAHFELIHERGEQSVAILWPSLAAIYQRYGYAYVTTNNTYNVDPQYLEFALPRAATGSFREIDDDEFPLLVDLYRKFRADRTAYIHRSRDQWGFHVLAPPSTNGLLVKVVYQENDEPLGYVVYTADTSNKPGAGAQIIIRDLIWLTFSAYHAAWSYFANMDLATNIVWRYAPGDDPLPHVLLEPRRLNTSLRDGMLGRIVDIEKALPQRLYDEEGTLTFEIIDDLCPWNQGRWKLEASPAGSAVSRTSEEPQLVMPVSTLALLVFGEISATQAARMERLDVVEDSALALWDGVMKTRYRPCCADYF